MIDSVIENYFISMFFQIVYFYSVIHCQYTVCDCLCYLLIVPTEISIVECFDSSFSNEWWWYYGKFIVRNEKFAKSKCTSNKKSSVWSITLVCFGLLDTNPLKVLEYEALETHALREEGFI